jgi:aryl-alcohol dehydrogenase-like predicted oxidoreductase
LVIATKGGLRIDQRRGLVRDSSPAWLRRGVEESLGALGVDYIDLYQVHWPDPLTPFAETAEALDDLVWEGKIRHVGVSNFDVSQIAEFARTRAVETLQPPYHLFRRDIESDVLPYSREHDIGVLAYERFASDRGHTVSQLAIAWALANPAVDVAIVGARRAPHIEDSVGALQLRLTPADMAEIDRLMSAAVAVAGPSPEAMP